MQRCTQCEREFSGPAWECPQCGFAPTVEGGILRFSQVADSGFEASFFQRLARLEAGFWWFEARNDLIAWTFRTYAGAEGSFLEIGCGTGFVSARLAKEFPRWRISASEFFAEGLAFVGKRIERATLFQLDARGLPFSDEFDAIGAFDVIEHIEDERAVLKEARRALKPNGLMFITVPQHPFLWSALDAHAHHERRYTRAELRHKLVAAGFDVVMLRSFVSLLMPLLLLSRLRPSSGEVDPEGEFKISPALNGMLRAIMRLEAAAIRAGVGFPFGGSLLAVARRT